MKINRNDPCPCGSGNINKEEDFFELHITRVVAAVAGLIRKYRGKFILSRDCRKILKEEGLSSIYLRLFKAHSTEFNWAYRDGYSNYGIVQHSFLCTLLLLQRYGHKWQPKKFYEERFLQAFPSVIDEVENAYYQQPEDVIRSCYSLRALKNYVEFLGLAEIRTTPGERFFSEFDIRKLPLVDAVVRFGF